MVYGGKEVYVRSSDKFTIEEVKEFQEALKVLDQKFNIWFELPISMPPQSDDSS